MSLQVKFDLPDREDVLSKLCDDVENIAENSDRSKASIIYKLDDYVDNMSADGFIAYKNMKKHVLLREFKEMVNDDKVERYELGDIYALMDVKDVEKEIKDAVRSRIDKE